MAEEPTETERAERRALARRIVEAFETEEPPPGVLGNLVFGPAWKWEVLTIAFSLAKELTQRDAELAAARQVLPECLCKNGKTGDGVAIVSHPRSQCERCGGAVFEET